MIVDKAGFIAYDILSTMPPLFSGKYSPRVVITKSQLLKLAFDAKYRDAFIEWLSDRIQEDSRQKSREMSIDIQYDLKILDKKYSELHQRDIIQFVKVPRLMWLLSRKKCKLLNMTIPADWDKDVSTYDGLEDLFLHSSKPEYALVIKDIFEWCQGMRASGSAYFRRVNGLPTVLNSLINETKSLIDRNQASALKEATSTMPGHMIDAQKYLDELLSIRLDIVDMQTTSLSDEDFQKQFSQYVLTVIAAVKKDLIDHATMIDEYAKKQSALEKEAIEIRNIINDFVTSLNSGDDSQGTLDALTAMDKARKKIHQTMSTASAAETEDGLNNTLMTAHQFDVYKRLEMLPILKQSDPDTFDFSALQIYLLTTLYVLGDCLERANSRFKDFALAREYVTKKNDAAKADSKQKKKEEESAGKDEYPFEPRIKNIIKSIKAKEKSLKQKDLIWSSSAYNKTLVDAKQTPDAVTAIGAMYGLDQSGTTELQQAKAMREDVDAGVDRYNALLNVVGDYLIRQISRFFYVIDSNTNRKFFIDFVLYENGIRTRDVYGSAKNAIDKNYMRYIKAQYETISQTHRTESYRMQIFKVIYQSYFLPFHYWEFKNDRNEVVRVLFREKQHRLKPRADTIFTGISSAGYSFNNKDAVAGLFDADKDIRLLKQNYGKIDDNHRDVVTDAVKACVITFKHMNDHLVRLVDLDESGEAATSFGLTVRDGIVVPMFKVWSVKAYVDNMPLQHIRTTCSQGVLPGWYTDELAFMFLETVFTDDEFSEYKGTLEKAWTRVKTVFTGGGTATNITNDRLHVYKRRIHDSFIGHIDTFCKSTDANDLFSVKRLNLRTLLEPIRISLEHVIIRSKLTYDKRQLICKKLLGNVGLKQGARSVTEVDEFLQRIVIKLAKANKPDENLPAADRKRAMKKMLAHILPNIAMMYDLPSELLDSMIANMSSSNCVYLAYAT